MSADPAREPPRVRLALAIIAACSTAAALYATLRLAQALLSKEPDPALVIWSEHAGFFWRALTVGYLGGMAGFVTWVLSARHPARVTAALVKGVVIAAVMATLQGVLVP